MTCLTFFFQYIEQRDGMLLNDWLLRSIPSIDVSLPLLFFIWSCVLLAIYRAAADPDMLITFLYAYIIFTASRMLTMYLVPLNPPLRLLPIKDPLSNLLYGDKFVTKDLFYSGHTGTLFLLYLCTKGAKDKMYMLLCTVAVAALLLVQHVHYTIDIMAAPICTFGCYLLGKWILRRGGYVAPNFMEGSRN